MTDSKTWAIALPTIEGMSENPIGWRIQQVEALCVVLGIKCVPPRGGGSHYKVSYPGNREILTIPSKRPIKPVYIKKLVAFVRSLQDAEQ